MGQLEQHNRLYNLINLFWPQREEKALIHRLLEPLNLGNCLFATTGKLSGGQQQRTAIARALFHKSSVLLADEPVANLDGPMANRALEILTQNKHTAVIALHNTEQALRFADRIIGIRDRSILFDAPASRITPSQLEALYEHGESK